MNPSQAIQEIVKLASINQQILMLGGPGIGKTAIAKAVSVEVSLPYYEVRAAEFEPVDFRGACYMNVEKRIAEWFPAEFWPTEKCVLCFDEISQATPDLTSVLLKVIRERKIGNVELHPETIIIATGNRVEHRAGANKLASALRESFVELTVEPDLSQWLDWYKLQPQYNAMIALYLKAFPAKFYLWDAKNDWNQPCPRNWDKLGSIERVTHTEGVFAGVIGAENATELLRWIDKHAAVPDVLDVLNGNATAPTGLTVQPQWVKALIDAAVDAQNPASIYSDVEERGIANLIDDLDDSWQFKVVEGLAKSGGRKLFRKPLWAKLMKRHAAAINAANK